MNRRWTSRPEGSNWGDFGADDEVGRLNLLTPDKVLEGAAQVKVGKSFCLSLPLDYPGGNAVNPKRFPPRLQPTLLEGRPFYNYRWGQVRPGLTDVSCDDSVLLHTQYSTQWDSLAHAGALFDADGDGQDEVVYYNGWRGGPDIQGPAPVAAQEGCAHASVRAARLGIETMAATGVQGRGVLVDLHAHLGDARTEVGYDQLMRILDADGVEVARGDIVLLHTGWTQWVLEMGGTPDAAFLHAACAVLDGHDARLLRWISDCGLAALAADNFAVEDGRHVLASDYRGPRLPLHHHCLFKLGVPLGELWYLRELAEWLRAHGRSHFLLTAPPLRLTGAVGSPVTPVATV